MMCYKMVGFSGMDQLKTTKLTAAKICHEIANHLSVMKFLQEDLKSSYIYEVKELLGTVDLLTATMDFFRNIYSASGSISSTSKVITEIYKLKGVVLKGSEFFYNFESSDEENIICGMLYIIIKSCKSGDVVSINREKMSWVITIKNKNRRFPEAVLSAINNREVLEDIFNVFVLYVKQLAMESRYDMLADEDDEEFLRVKIWKK